MLPLALAFLVLAAAPFLTVVPGIGPLILVARRVVDRYATPAAPAFLLASAALAVIGYMLQAFIHDRLGVDVPYATLRWFLVLPDLGLGQHFSHGAARS